MTTASELLISRAAAVARLATNRRVSSSRGVASSSFRRVISRAIDDAPTIRPLVEHDAFACFRRGKPPKTRRAGGVDVLRPEFRVDQQDARETSRPSSQLEQTPYSLMCVSERPVLTAARYAVEGSIPRARARHSSQKLRGFCATRNAATFSLAIIVSHSKHERTRAEKNQI